MGDSATGLAISDAMLKGLTAKAVDHVFASNINRPAEVTGQLTAKELSEAYGEGVEEDLISCEVVIYEDFNAVLCVQYPRALIKLTATDYLGYEEAQLDFDDNGMQIYHDTAREMTNMAAGTFRNILAQAKVECRLKPPEIHTNCKVALLKIAKARQTVVLKMNVEEHTLFNILFIPEQS